MGFGKIKLFLLGAFLLFGLDKKEPMFNCFKYEDYCIGKCLVDIDQDGVKDLVTAFYDFNKNGKIDFIANYRIEAINPLGVLFEPYACLISIDEDEDKEPEYWMFDKNLDRTLETKLKNKKSKENLGVSI